MHEKRKWGALRKIFEESGRIKRIRTRFADDKNVRRCLQLLPEKFKPFQRWCGPPAKNTMESSDSAKKENDDDEDDEADDGATESMLVLEVPVDQQILLTIQSSGNMGISQPVCMLTTIPTGTLWSDVRVFDRNCGAHCD
jgi:hypothetical protein